MVYVTKEDPKDNGWTT